MQVYYFESPHKQIGEDFFARVQQVHDGDTIKVTTDFRDFAFPIRFINIAAPELKEEGGIKARDWLRSELLGKEILVKINPKNRVEKWGRLLGSIIYQGMDMGELEIQVGLAVPFENRHDIPFPDFNRTLNAEELKWESQ